MFSYKRELVGATLMFKQEAHLSSGNPMFWICLFVFVMFLLGMIVPWDSSS